MQKSHKKKASDFDELVNLNNVLKGEGAESQDFLEILRLIRESK